jgi:ParB family chromosome partitioning protein
MARRTLKEFLNTTETSQSPQPMKILLSDIVLPSQQPRRYFDPTKMERLIQSVKEHGILENLLVRPIPQQQGKYELVAGERRYRAALALGLLEIPVSIRELSDAESFTIALIENLQREDLNPVEETEGILGLLSLRLKCSQNEVVALLYRMLNDISRMTDNVISQPDAETVKATFEELGLMGWESFISNRLPLLKLPDEILESLRQGKIAYTKATVIARVKDEQFRKILLTEAINSEMSLNEIKGKVRYHNDSISKQEKSTGIKQRLTHILGQVKKTDFISDTQKKEQLEILLSQMEDLLKDIL